MPEAGAGARQSPDQRFGRSLSRICQKNGISHEAVNLRAGVRARGAIHLNHVNGWHSRFTRWLARFHGVASRYLIHYSGWRRVLDARCLTTPARLLAAAIKAG